MCIVALASLPSASADMGLAPAIIMLAMAILVIVVLVLVLVLIEVLQVCYHSHCREVFCPIEHKFLQCSAKLPYPECQDVILRHNW